MIEIMIKSLKDQSLRTSCDHHFLVSGEVSLVRFKDVKEFEAYQGLGVFLPAPQGAKESRNIPVIRSTVDELPLALHDGEDVLELCSDPDFDIGEPCFDSMDISETCGEIPEDEEDDSCDEDEYWTNEIDHI